MLLSKSYYNGILIFLIISNFVLWDYFGGIYQLRFLFLLSVPLLFLTKGNHDLFNKKYLIITFFTGLILFTHIYFSSYNIKIPIQHISIIKILILSLFAYTALLNLQFFYSKFNKIIKYALLLILFYYFFELFLNFGSLKNNLLNYGIIYNCYDAFQVQYANLFAEDSHLGMITPAFIISAIIINIKEKRSINSYLPIIFLIILITLYSLSITFIASMMIGSGLAILQISGFKYKIFFTILIILLFVAIKNFNHCASKLINVAMGIFEQVEYTYPDLFKELDTLETSKSKTKPIKKTSPDLFKELDTLETSKSKTKPIKNTLKKIIRFTDKYIKENHQHYEIRKKEEFSPKKIINPNTYKISKIDAIHLNVSTAVYINSLQVLNKTLRNYPFGLGMDNYEFIFKKYIDLTTKETEYENSVNKAVLVLNQADASNNLVKLSTEFGIFSLLIYLVLILFFFNKKIKLEVKIFLLTIILTQIFVRGAGYFNGGFILALLILIFLNFKKKINE